MGLQHSRQIRQGGVELVQALTQRGPQNHNRLGCLLEAPPRGERGLGIAGVARIARDTTQLQVALRQAKRKRQILRLVRQLTVQGA